MNTNTILVHKTDEAGAIIVDRMTGSILTPSNERPDWAEGLAAAMLAERVGWYENRLGKNLPDTLRSPHACNYADLSWVGVDAEGDEVEIEAAAEYRMTTLAAIMELDLDADNFELPVSGEVAHAFTDYTYTTTPGTDEQTLAEVEGQTFGVAHEERKTASSGA